MTIKKIDIIIIFTIITTITSSLLFNQKPKHQKDINNIQIIENTQINTNPSGEGVKIQEKKILGASKVTEEDQKDKKLVFETIKLYLLINSYRKENKLTPLNINKSLEASSKKKIADMIENKYFRHQDTNNNESWYLFKTSGYEFKTAGENLSAGTNTPWKVFEAWKNSELHNAQMLGNKFLDMGITADCESYSIANKPSCIVVLHLGSR